MRRRKALKLLASAWGAMSATPALASGLSKAGFSPAPATARREGESAILRLFLCGDVMSGRGIDQILPHPGDPAIHEPWVSDARDYVALAERLNGPVPAPVAADYIWGDALPVLDRFAPDVRLINLETAVTASDDHWPGKGIHYRMHPRNIGCLKAAAIDACSLANNHVLDWGHDGLQETLATLARAGIGTVGAGPGLRQARAPVIVADSVGSRVLIFGAGTESSGIPAAWAATGKLAGVNLVPEHQPQWLEEFAAQIRVHRRPGDVVVCSIHWGGNWGYEVPDFRRELAHRLIDEVGVDIIHGHSSHHPLGIESYHGRIILYGCGDFINDYEGISGHERYRGDLALMYLIRFDARQRRLVDLQMVPLQIHGMRLHRADRMDARWLQKTLDRESRKLGSHVGLTEDFCLRLGQAPP